MLRYILFLVLALNVLPLIGYAQTEVKISSFSGVVSNKNIASSDANDKLTGAVVMWLNSRKATLTDNNGKFRLDRLTGDTRLVVSLTGFKADTFDVGEKDYMVFALSEKQEQKGEVVITESLYSSQEMVNAIANTGIMREKELFKAACCNLSESFETNPSVDMNYADAVTGAKQIQMLGLSGIYTQLQTENVPGARGLAANYGLSYTPGPWVESIQITKGVGTVVNGFESMAGQINIEQKKPEGKEALLANGYINQMARSELNLNITKALKDSNWHVGTYLHADASLMKLDRNKDGFLDVPLQRTISGMNRWKYDGLKYKVQLGVRALYENRIGGQVAFNPEKPLIGVYGIQLNTNRWEGFSKVARVMAKPYQSIALISQVVAHNQNFQFGNRFYLASQRSVYNNLIYQSIIGSTLHQFRTGISMQSDFYNEDLVSDVKYNFRRAEQVIGGFYEHTWLATEKLSMIGGLRVDYNSIFGLFATPRIHAKYDITDKVRFRVSGGRGQRTANIIAENASILASARSLNIIAGNDKVAYGLNPEVSWNYGASLTKDFSFNGKKASLVLDYYRTDFSNQVVVDLENSRSITFYNLVGRSYANSYQAELNIKPVRRFDVRLSARYYDVGLDYVSGFKSRPMVAPFRGFLNLAYETRTKWKFDATLQYISQKRLPLTALRPTDIDGKSFSPSYWQINAQVAKNFGTRTEFYFGVENITDFRQNDLILAANNPYGGNFDSSIVWGPILGAMPYFGFRYKIVRD